MPAISHQHRTIFLHNPKAAGVSIISALQKHGFVRAWHDPDWETDPWEHWYEVPSRYSGYHVFSVCRNPYDRFVSLWKFRIDRSKVVDPSVGLADFDPAASDWGVTGQFQYHYIERSNECIDFDSLPAVLRVNGLELPLERLNATPHLPWRRYYDQSTAERCFSIYERDFSAIRKICGADLKDSWRYG